MIAVIPILLFLFIPLFVFISVWIKGCIIKYMHSRQLKAVQAQAQNPLKQAKHPMRIEWCYSAGAFFASGGPIYVLFILMSIAKIFAEGFKDKYQQDLVTYLLYMLLFFLLDLAVFLIRMAAGRIQGAILFDPQKKRIYAFRSVTTVCNLVGYKECHESKLVYAQECWSRYMVFAYVFFTKYKNEYAFKVEDIKENDFGKMLSQQEPADIFIPFKHSYHLLLLEIVSIILALLSPYWILTFLHQGH